MRPLLRSGPPRPPGLVHLARQREALPPCCPLQDRSTTPTSTSTSTYRSDAIGDAGAGRGAPSSVLLGHSATGRAGPSHSLPGIDRIVDSRGHGQWFSSCASSLTITSFESFGLMRLLFDGVGPHRPSRPGPPFACQRVAGRIAWHRGNRGVNCGAKRRRGATPSCDGCRSVSGFRPTPACRVASSSALGSHDAAVQVAAANMAAYLLGDSHADHTPTSRHCRQPPRWRPSACRQCSISGGGRRGVGARGTAAAPRPTPPSDQTAASRCVTVNIN